MAERAAQLRIDGTEENPPPEDWWELSNTDRLRWLLSDGRWHNWRELEKVAGVRFGARVFELRASGMAIAARWRGAHNPEYRWPPPAGAPAAQREPGGEG